MPEEAGNEQLSPGADRESQRRRVARPAAQAPEGDACACLRQLAGVPRQVRRGRRASGATAARWPTCAKFPFTTKQDLRDSYPFGMFAVPREQCARIHASSGTTGKPTVVGYTRNDIETWSHVMARSIRAAGARPGDLVHVSYGYGLFTGGLGAHYGAEKLGLTVVPFGGGQTERQVQLINDFRPDIIMVTPSYMLAIADEFERQGLDPAQSSLRLGIFGAEPWTNDMRASHRAAHGHGCRGHLRPVGSDGPGRGQRVRGDQGRPDDLGRPLLSRRSSIRKAASRWPTASSASWCSPA